MDWSELNEKFRKFDELCDSLLGKELKPSDEEQRPLEIDVSNCKESNLLCYSVLMPNELRPITYSNVTNQLLGELLGDEWFRNRGTLLRTLEKGVFHPVLHLSGIPNQNDRDSVELFRANRFGKSYTLYQAVYQELNVIELPVITRKKTKSGTTDLTGSHTGSHRMSDALEEEVRDRMERTVGQNDERHVAATKDEDYLKLDCTDFSWTDDSGCVSLNSTATNDYCSSEETAAAVKYTMHNSMESLSSSYDSNDSMLNSIKSEQPKREDELAESIRNDCSSRTATKPKKAKPINCSSLVNNLVTDMLVRSSLANELAATSLSGLNEGHVIIGFRIKDKFFRDCFESNWLEMSGARLFYPISASRFGLRTIKFWKRIGLNSERGSSFDDGITFNYIVYAEFLNLTAKNEIYLTNFVHRLRLRSLGAITLYTNLN